MKTLRLPITTQWFDMILGGQKLDEYRSVKISITQRLYHKDGTLKHWDAVEYTAGYGYHHPRVVLSLRGPIHIATGREDWGAEPGVEYYTIPLGSILETHNLKPYQKGLIHLSQRKDAMHGVSTSHQ